MNRARVAIAADRLSAELHVTAGEPASPQEARSALAAGGVVFGIDEAALAPLAAGLAEPQFQGHAVVAHGTPARPGADGSVEWTFAIAPQVGQRRANGVIDYHERDLLHPVTAGGVVARIVPPTPGQPGRDVRGQTIAAPPVKAATLRLGSGVALQQDGSVLALRDGVVTLPAGGVDVLPLYEHKGDVDLHSGNLRSNGSLLVTGDLHADFAVEADGDVMVRGSCFGGTVRAGGRVEIGLGVQSGCSIEAGGDIVCRHATNAALSADGAVCVRDEIVHCAATAARIELLEGRGRVLGGSLRALLTIDVLAAGGPSAAPTLLAVADQTSTAQELVRRTHQHERVERRAQKLGQIQGLGGPARGGKIGRQMTTTANAVQDARLEQARRQRELLRTASIAVRQRLHAGVRIQLGGASLTVAEDRGGARFRWDEVNGTIVQEAP